MSTPIVIRYPLDPTGVSVNNLIVDEVHSNLPNRATRAVAPRNGPFYTESLRVFDAITDQELVRGRDFHAVEYYEIPSRKYGKEVCAVVLLVNPNQSQDVRLEYQCVGGEFSYSIDAVVRMIESLNLDDRPVRWPDILDLPPSFTPSPHLHDIGDTYGWEFIIQALENLRRAILLGDVASHDEIFNYIDRVRDALIAITDNIEAALTAHINDIGNPHRVTKAQVGLGAVQNYGIATRQIAEEGTSNTHYLTPLRAAELIEVTAGAALRQHLADKENPHGTTKAQVGLGLVQNYGISSASQDEAANSNTVYSTPAGVRRTIDAIIRPALNAHIADTNNPHGTTKAQVGLGNIPNSLTNSRSLDSDGSLLTAKGMHDHVNSGDHDSRYIQKNVAVPLAIRQVGQSVQIFVDNTWRQIWPAQWA